MKLDKKIVLIPAIKSNEDIIIPDVISKKTIKKTIKKRPKLKTAENSNENSIVSVKPIKPKILNPKTGRYIKNTPANRRKIEKQTLKSGGRSKKRTRKNKNNKSNKYK